MQVCFFAFTEVKTDLTKAHLKIHVKSWAIDVCADDVQHKNNEVRNSVGVCCILIGIILCLCVLLQFVSCFFFGCLTPPHPKHW